MCQQSHHDHEHHEHAIRAWKDEEYRLSLSEAERQQLPENPIGSIEMLDELADEEMANLAGGLNTISTLSNITQLAASKCCCSVSHHCSLDPITRSHVINPAINPSSLGATGL